MKESLRVLIVEDSEDDALFLSRELTRGDFDVRFERVETRNEFVDALRAKPWDVILCDYKMPKFSGTEALKLYKQSSLDIPFIFVSGTMGEDIAIEAMKCGAHDYLVKGNLKRLIPAIHRELHEAKERADKRRLEHELVKLVHQLQTRVKELTALQHTSHLLQDTHQPLDALLTKFVRILPAAWQYSEDAAARVTIDGTEYATPKFKDTNRKQIGRFVGPEGRDGVIEVCYLEEKPQEYEGPFLHEERALIDSMAEMLTSYFERRQTEEAIWESEEKFKSLAEQSPNMIFINKGGRVVYANNRCVEIMGYTVEEFYDPGFDFLSLIAPDYVAKIKECFQKHMAGEDVDAMDYELVAKEGKRINAIISSKLISYERERAILGIVTDITEHKRVEDALRLSKDEWEKTFDAVPDLVMILDSQYHIRRVNQAMANRLKMQPAACVDLTCYEAVHGMNEPPDFCPHVQLLRDGKRHEAEVNEQRLGGLFTVTDSPIHDANGRLVGGVHVARDITEPRRVEEALRKSEQQFRSVWEHSGDGMRLTDKDGTIMLVNDAYCRMVGKPRSELEGKRMDVLYDEEYGPIALQRYVTRFSSRSLEEHQEREMTLWDGRKKWFELTTSFMELDQHEKALLAIFRDVTDRNDAQKAATEQFKMVEAVFANSIICLAVLDKEFNFVRVNEAYAKSCRKEIQQFVGHNHFEFYPSDAKSIFEEVVRTKQPFQTFARPFVYPDQPDRGVTYWDWTIVPILDSKGEVEYLLFSLLDVTKRKETEDKLKESDARLRLIAENMLDMVSQVDMRGKYLYVSPAHRHVTGYDPASLLGTSMFDHVHPDDRERVTEEVRRAAAEPKDTKLELRYWCADGRCIWLETRGKFIVNERGKAVGAILTSRDITERKMAEEAVRISELKYKNLAEFAPVGLYQSMHDGTLLAANTSLATMLGYDSVEELLRINLAADVYVKKEDRERLVALVEAQGFIRDAEVQWRKKDRSVMWASLYSHTVKDTEGKFRCFEGFVRDVTERRRREEELRRLYHAIEQSPVSIIITDTNGNIEYVNAKFQRVTGYALDEAIGQNPRLLKSGYTKPEEYAHLWETITGGNVWQGTFQNKRKSGELFWEAASISPVRNAEGLITNFVAVKEDITERKAMEDRVLRSQRLESLGVLAGGIAHDLNNVLAPVLMSIEVLKKHFPDEMSGKILDSVESSARRGKDVIKQILSFARGASGEKVVIQPKHVIREVESLIRETFPRGIAIRFDVPSDLYTILADATQIHQVLMNLCVNARDAMPGGGTLAVTARNIELTAADVRVHPEAHEGQYIKVVVSDTGTGIAPKVMNQIFDPFFTTKERGKGTGLGLTTVHTLAKAHQGFVDVESQFGRGATFTLFLPAHRGAEEAAAPEGVADHGHGETILVVDDEESIRDVAKTILESQGYRVYLAADGTEGIALFAQKKEDIQLVITDLMMPFMDGATLVRAMRRMSPNVKVIAATGLMIADETNTSVEREVQGMISKPFTAQALLKLVQHVLKK